MGFSANFVSAKRKVDDQNRDVLLVQGISEEKDMPNEPEPWKSLTPADVKEMFVAVVDASGDMSAFTRVLGARVLHVDTTANWSVEIKSEHPADPQLPAKDTPILVVGTTTFKTLDREFCWAESMSVGE